LKIPLTQLNWWEIEHSLAALVQQTRCIWENREDREEFQLQVRTVSISQYHSTLGVQGWK
jgi:hypothetical protein